MTQQQSKPKAKFTVADYMKTPDDQRYQLIDGELILAPSPTSRHQFVSLRLAVALFRFVEQHELGLVLAVPVDVVLADHEVFQPDILYPTSGGGY